MKQRNSGLILSYINIVLSTVIGLFMSSFILKKLGATEYGIYQIVASFANYLVLLQFGAGTVMTRNIAKLRGEKKSQKEIDENISTIFTISIVLVGILIAASAVFYCLLDDIYRNLTIDQLRLAKKLFIYISIYMVCNFVLQTVNGIFQGFEKFVFVKGIAVVKIIIRTVMVVAIFSFVPTALALVVIDMTIDVIILLLTVINCKLNFKIKVSLFLFQKDIFKSSMPLAFALFLQSIVNQANNNVDKFLISIFMSPEAVTVYAVAMFIYSAYSSVSTIPISIYLPKVVKDIGGGLHGKELTDTLIQPSRLLTLIGGTVMFGFITVGKQFVEIFYGVECSEAYYITVIIMVPMFVNMSNGILINVLDALGKRMSRSLILIGTTVANIILTAWWINVFGMIGAALATAICTFVGQIIIMNIYYYKVIKIPIFYMMKRIYKGLLPAFLISVLCGRLIMAFFHGNLILQLLVGGIVFVIVLIAILWMFGFNKSEKDFIMLSVKKICK